MRLFEPVVQTVGALGAEEKRIALAPLLLAEELPEVIAVALKPVWARRP